MSIARNNRQAKAAVATRPSRHMTMLADFTKKGNRNYGNNTMFI